MTMHQICTILLKIIFLFIFRLIKYNYENFLIGLVAIVSTLITGQSDSIDEANSYYFWPEDYQQFPKDLIAQYDQRTSSPQYPTLIDNCCVNRVDFKERVFLVYFCTDLIFEIEVP